MGRDPVEKECGEHVYRVLPLPPKRALKLLGRIGRLVGPALGHLADGAMRGSSIQDILDKDTSELGDMSIGIVAAELFDRWEDTAVEAVLDELASVSFVLLGGGEGQAPLLKSIFEDHFTGRLKDLVLWITFALEVQYGDFISGSGGLIKFLAQQSAKRQASPSPKG